MPPNSSRNIFSSCSQVALLSYLIPRLMRRMFEVVMCSPLCAKDDASAVSDKKKIKTLTKEATRKSRRNLALPTHKGEITVLVHPSVDYWPALKICRKYSRGTDHANARSPCLFLRLTLKQCAQNTHRTRFWTATLDSHDWKSQYTKARLRKR